MPPSPLTGLPATTGKLVFLLALSPTLPKIPIVPLPLPNPPTAAPPRLHILVAAVDPNPITVVARLSDEAVGRANVVPGPCVVDTKGNDASSLAFRFPFRFSGVPLSLVPSVVTNPKLVFGRLGGGTTNLSSA